MDILNSWSLKIAKEVTPDEIDLAPIMTQAFVKGGKAREDLFYQEKKGALGGFGVSEIPTVFPWVLKTVAITAPIISTMLAAIPHIKDFLSIVKNTLDIQKNIEQRKKSKTLPDDPYAPLKRAMDAISKELQAIQIPQEQRDLIVYRVLCTLLEDPTGATQFVQKIGEAANG